MNGFRSNHRSTAQLLAYTLLLSLINSSYVFAAKNVSVTTGSSVLEVFEPLDGSVEHSAPIKTPTIPSTIPSNFKVIELRSDYVKIGWSQLAGIKNPIRYKIFRDYKFLYDSNNPWLTDSSVKAGTSYVYAVRVFDESNPSDVLSMRKIKVSTPHVLPLNNTNIPNDRDKKVQDTLLQASVKEELSLLTLKPEHYDDKLPMGGLFYGTLKGGMIVGNGPIAYTSAIRFRGERSGLVNAVRYNNRRLSRKDIAIRCDRNGTDSTWCACEDAGLDANACGYTLANSYHVGTGGLITIELRNDDGTSEHLPGETVLANTEAYVPVQLEGKYPTVDFTKPVEIIAGNIYHLVFRNENPPVGCGLRKLSVEEAAECPPDQGAIGLNGTKHGSDPAGNYRYGPYLGIVGSGLLYKGSPDSQWSRWDDVTAFYELRYSDGEFVGDAYTGFDNPNYGNTKGTQTIQGSIVARQEFKVTDAGRLVDGLWLQFGHPHDQSITGEPLSISVKSSNGRILARGEIQPSKDCSAIALEAGVDGKQRGTREDWMCRTWGYTDLSETVHLRKAQKYSIDFSAPAGAGFDISTFFSYHRLSSRNIWENASAMISRNKGKTWKSWTTKWSSRDIAVLFTISGKPKYLP